MRLFKHSLILAVVTLFLFTMSSFAVFNVWEDEAGVAARRGHHLWWYNSPTAVAENGDWATVWSAADSGTQNIYIQVLSPDGTLLFPEGGIQVTNGNWPQHNPQILSLNENGWLVSWLDYRIEDEDSDQNVYLQRISCEGTLLWDENGITPFSNNEGPSGWNILPCDENSILVYARCHPDLIFQKISLDGIIQFDETIVYDAHTNMGVAPDNSGGMYFCWCEYGTNDLRINRMNSEGEFLFGTNQHGIVIQNLIRRSNVSYKLISDGNDGALFLWSYPTDSENSEIYGLHISGEGELNWPDDHTVVVDGDGIQWIRDIIPDGNGSFLVLWTEGESTSEQFDTRVTKFSLGENGPEFSWDGGNDGVSLGEGYVQYPRTRFVSDGQGGALVSWFIGTLDDHDPVYLNLANVLGDGNLNWATNPNSLEIDYYVSLESIALYPHENTFHLGWKAFKDDHSKILLKDLSLSTGESASEDDPIALTSGIAAWGEDPVMCVSGSGVYTVWDDSRQAFSDNLNYIQRFDTETGEATFTENGICLTPGLKHHNGAYSRLMIGETSCLQQGEDGIVVSWEQYMRETGGPTYWKNLLQSVDEEGNLLWGDSALHYSMTENQNYSVQSPLFLVKSQGPEVSFIYLGGNRALGEYHFYVQKLDENGQPAWDEADGRIVHSRTGVTQLLKVVQLEDLSCIVFFSGTNGGNEPFLFAMKVSIEGEMLWDFPVEVIPLNRGLTQLSSISTALLDGAIVIGVKRVNLAANDGLLSINGVTLDGNRLWNSNIDLESSTNHITEILISRRTENTFWVSRDRSDYFEVSYYNLNQQLVRTLDNHFSANRNQWAMLQMDDTAGGFYLIWSSGTNNDISKYFVHLNVNGDFCDDAYTDEGLQMTHGVGHEGHCSIVPDGECGFYCSWMDGRASLGEISSEGFGEEHDIYVMRYNDNTTGVSEYSGQSLPSKWSLAPAYPNPFNPSTRIGFTVPEASRVTINIHDVLGRSVQTLLDKSVQAGSYKFVWDSKGKLASGTYFITMEAGKFKQSRQISLIK